MIEFVWYNRSNRAYLIIAICCISVTWGLFKVFYPYPNFVFDSYQYIRAAVLDLPVSTWPIGYSKFLHLYGWFSHSPILFTGLQYGFLEFSCLALFFSWRFLLQPRKWTSRIVFFLLFLNPLFLYCSNFINSDSLFIGLSLLWFVQLLFIIWRPRPYMIFTHAVLLGLVFTIRYNALYYPFVAAVAFLMSRQRFWVKAVGILLPFIVVGGFVLYTGNRIKAISGQWQFSPFAGWKLANDALYFYPYVQANNNSQMPVQLAHLDSMVRRYLAEGKFNERVIQSDFTFGSHFMLNPYSPLNQFPRELYGARDPIMNIKVWMTVAPLYQSYGIFLIKKYPVEYFRYFMVPNLKNYFLPPGEIFETPESFIWRGAYGESVVRSQFTIQKVDFKPSVIIAGLRILEYFPILFLLIHICFILGLVGFVFLGGFSNMSRLHRCCILLVALLWGCDFGFSIVSAFVVLRYEIFIVIVEIAFGAYYVESIYHGFDRNYRKVLQ